MRFKFTGMHIKAALSNYLDIQAILTRRLPYITRYLWDLTMDLKSIKI